MGGIRDVGAWPLTGRVEELRLINECFDGRGRSAGVAILGPAGVGKSRLAREAAMAAATAGAVVRWAVATESARAIPLGAFSQWTAGLQESPLQLASGVIEAVTAAPAGHHSVVAVDDAHLLDDLSAFVLHQLVLRRSASVIVSIRSGEPVPDAVTALWKDRHLELLELQPLSCDDSDELLCRALNGPVDPDCAQRMWGFTGGNVLYMRHLVDQERIAGRLAKRDGRWMWTGTPQVSPSLLGLIEAQVGSVPEGVLEVVDLVAVAEPIETGMLARVVDSSMVEEAERRGLIGITGSGGVVHIGHPLYGEIRRRQAGHSRLRRLRGMVAQVYAADVDRDDVDGVIRLGLLWLESDLPPDPRLFLRTAQAAAMRLDLGLVERMADASTRAGGGPDPAILLAQTFLYLDRAHEVEKLLTALDVDELDDDQLSTVTIVRSANYLWPLGRPQQSWDLIESALTESNSTVRPALQAFRAVQLAFAARPSEAITLAQQLDLRELPDVAALAAATFGLVLALGDVGRIDDAKSLAAQSHARASRSRDFAYIEVWLTEIHVAALLLAGALVDAVKVADDFNRHCADGSSFTHAVSETILGMAALGCCRLDAAQRRLASAIAVFAATEETPPIRYRATIISVEIFSKLGNVGAAAGALTDMERLRHPSFEYLEADRLLAAAWEAAGRGAITSAITKAGSAADYARSHGQLAREVVSLQTATHFGDKTTTTRLTELRDLVQGPRAAAAAAFATALTASDGAGLQAASARFEAMGDLFAAADIAAHAAIAFRRHDRRGSALTAAGRAQRLAAECGGAVSAALREAAEPLPLTTRAREIISLAAQGLSNREIADMLQLSIRSVEGHLYRASVKAGANSRAELSALVREFDT